MPPPASSRNRLVDILTIAAFLAAIYGSLALTVLHRGSSIITSEKRARAGRPQFSLSGWFGNRFQPAFERFFNDRFGGRDQLVRWNNVVHVAAFELSPVKLTMIGRDGQLLYAADGIVDDYRQTHLFTPAELRTITAKLQAMRDDADARGATFVMLIAPNEQTVYPQSMPATYNRVGSISRFDQVMTAMAGSNVTIIDPRATLRDAARTARVYYRSDTHWNNLGAFLAYRQLTDALYQQRRDIRPLAVADLHPETGWTEGGDLAVALSLADRYPEFTTWLLPNRPTRAALATVDYPGLNLRRPPKVTVIDDPRLPRAVIFRDSFGNAMAPWLSELFRRTVFIRAARTIPAVLEQERPDVVIFEIAERSLPLLLTQDDTSPGGD